MVGGVGGEGAGGWGGGGEVTVSTIYHYATHDRKQTESLIFERKVNRPFVHGSLKLTYPTTYQRANHNNN